MRAVFFLCIAAALLSGCASNSPTQVANATATAPAPFVEGIPIEEAVENNQPVALDIVETSAEKQPSANDPDKLVCKEISTIGTRLTRRVCRTQAQIAADREEAMKKTATLTSRAVPYSEKPMKMGGPNQ